MRLIRTRRKPSTQSLVLTYVNFITVVFQTDTRVIRQRIYSVLTAALLHNGRGDALGVDAYQGEVIIQAELIGVEKLVIVEAVQRAVDEGNCVTNLVEQGHRFLAGRFPVFHDFPMGGQLGAELRHVFLAPVENQELPGTGLVLQALKVRHQHLVIVATLRDRHGL